MFLLFCATESMINWSRITPKSKFKHVSYIHAMGLRFVLCLLGQNKSSKDYQVHYQVWHWVGNYFVFLLKRIPFVVLKMCIETWTILIVMQRNSCSLDALRQLCKINPWTQKLYIYRIVGGLDMFLGHLLYYFFYFFWMIIQKHKSSLWQLL